MGWLIPTEKWAHFERDGFLKLGKVLSDSDLTCLQRRIDEIMLGEADVDFERLLMQLDSPTGKYADAPSQTMGWKGRTLDYRKIQNLEIDPLFLDYITHPVFREVCQRIYGDGVPVSCFRAMFMNKPANKGTELPWHQDAWVYLDRQPIATLWTALDPATVANGCVKGVRGSHRLGRINPDHHSGFLTDEQATEICKPEDVVYLELEAGEVALLHNWMVHSSEVNRTETSRRGFSVCYMDGRTESTSDEEYAPLFQTAPRLRPKETS